MLINGKNTEINEKAFGGYYSKDIEFIVKRNNNINHCKAEPTINGGKKKSKKSKKSKKKLQDKNIKRYVTRKMY
jgi:hypothetical protein